MFGSCCICAKFGLLCEAHALRASTSLKMHCCGEPFSTRRKGSAVDLASVALIPSTTDESCPADTVPSILNCVQILLKEYYICKATMSYLPKLMSHSPAPS